MSSKKIHIDENDDNIESQNVKLETMEKGHFRNRYIKDNALSEVDEELLNYDDSKIVCYGIKRNLLIKRLLLPLFPGGQITVTHFYVSLF